MRNLAIVITIVCFFPLTSVAYEPIDFAFGENGSWSVIYVNEAGRRIYKYVNFSDSSSKQVDEFNAYGRSMRGIGLDGKNGWVVISETANLNFTAVENLYAEAKNKIDRLRASSGQYIKDVALTSSGGYVIIYGRMNTNETFWVYKNIPLSMQQCLDKLKFEGTNLRGAGISPNGDWVIVYSHRHRNCCHVHKHGNFPSEALPYMRDKS